jgi:hypothetical protein
MNIAAFSKLFYFSFRPLIIQAGHREAALFLSRNHRCRNDQYTKRPPNDTSKSISHIKPLHDHVITAILTPANGECTLWKYSL